MGLYLRSGQSGKRPIISHDRTNRQYRLYEPPSSVYQSGGRREYHVVLVLDQAGWHVAKYLTVPKNITLLYLPPYSPELNCVERLWAYLKNHYLSNRTYKGYDDLFDASSTAWNKLLPEQFMSICRTAWLHEN